MAIDASKQRTAEAIANNGLRYPSCRSRAVENRSTGYDRLAVPDRLSCRWVCQVTYHLAYGDIHSFERKHTFRDRLVETYDMELRKFVLTAFAADDCLICVLVGTRGR